MTDDRGGLRLEAASPVVSGGGGGRRWRAVARAEVTFEHVFEGVDSSAIKNLKFIKICIWTYVDISRY